MKDDKWKSTPLLYACQNGRPKIVKLLIEKGANSKAESSLDIALWTKPWRNFFEYFEIMVLNDTMNPETLYEHGKVAQCMLKEP